MKLTICIIVFIIIFFLLVFSICNTCRKSLKPNRLLQKRKPFMKPIKKRMRDTFVSTPTVEVVDSADSELQAVIDDTFNLVF